MCTTTCAVTGFSNLATHKCISCDYSCYRCFGNQTNCTKCTSVSGVNLFLFIFNNGNKTCISNCTPGYYA